jgi:hypothetical protein
MGDEKGWHGREEDWFSLCEWTNVEGDELLFGTFGPT